MFNTVLGVKCKIANGVKTFKTKAQRLNCYENTFHLTCLNYESTKIHTHILERIRTLLSDRAIQRGHS